MKDGNWQDPESAPKDKMIFAAFEGGGIIPVIAKWDFAISRWVSASILKYSRKIEYNDSDFAPECAEDKELLKWAEIK